MIDAWTVKATGLYEMPFGRKWGTGLKRFWETFLKVFWRFWCTNKARKPLHKITTQED